MNRGGYPEIVLRMTVCMVTLAGLDNTDVAGKQAMVETTVLAATVMNALGDAVPADLQVQVAEMQSEMEV